MQLTKQYILDSSQARFPENVVHFTSINSGLTECDATEFDQFINLNIINVSDNELSMSDFVQIPVRHLLVSNNKIQQIRPYLSFDYLEVLDLSNNCINLESFLALRNLPILRELDITGNNLSVLPTPKSFPCCFKSLERLVAERNNLHSEDCLRFLSTLPNLRELLLAYNNLSNLSSMIDETELSKHGSSAPLTLFSKLEFLDLAFNQFQTEESISTIPKLIKNSKIFELLGEQNNNDFSTDDEVSVAKSVRVIGFKRLKKLIIYGNPLLGASGEDPLCLRIGGIISDIVESAKMDINLSQMRKVNAKRRINAIIADADDDSMNSNDTPFSGISNQSISAQYAFQSDSFGDSSASCSKASSSSSLSSLQSTIEIITEYPRKRCLHRIRQLQPDFVPRRRRSTRNSSSSSSTTGQLSKKTDGTTFRQIMYRDFALMSVPENAECNPTVMIEKKRKRLLMTREANSAQLTSYKRGVTESIMKSLEEESFNTLAHLNDQVTVELNDLRPNSSRLQLKSIQKCEADFAHQYCIKSNQMMNDIFISKYQETDLIPSALNTQNDIMTSNNTTQPTILKPALPNSFRRDNFKPSAVLLKRAIKDLKTIMSSPITAMPHYKSKHLAEII